MKPAFLHLKCGPDGIKAEGDTSYYHGNAVEQDDGTRNGVYAEWSWDGATLHASNCRYGMSPLFYYCGKNEFCISNSIPKIIERGAPIDWDDDAMAVFIRRHSFLGEDTPFKKIRTTPPSAKLIWQNGQMTIKGHRPTSKLQHLKRSTIIEGVIELFSSSIKRRLPESENFYLPLTGGKDSRHILLELARQSSLPKACVTASFPPPFTNQDSEIASLLAKKLDLPHVIIPPSDRGLIDEERKNLHTNFCTIDHGWALPLTQFLQANASESYDGLGLDVYFSTMWHSEKRAALYNEGSFKKLAEDFLGDSENALSLIFTPEIIQRFSRRKALQRLTEEIELHADAPHPIAAFQFWSRTRRNTATFTFGLQNSVPKVHTPYLDHELFDFVTALSPDENFAIHTDALLAAYPEFSSAPFVTSGVPNRPSSWRIRQMSLSLLSELLSRSKTPSAMRSLSVAARLTKGCFSGNSADYDWLQPLLVFHLKQLENLRSI
ncbi:hypothetical protein [Pelagibius sp. Alg239-R121]|uniref:hypothetical protein n=1 Tax=Pelagibius sp. Alg239-R121 TaxID=2993448 RepID=UPI0024A63EFA|nr:hypothetical protein [Pelagibius sp. Alg239-R121]